MPCAPAVSSSSSPPSAAAFVQVCPQEAWAAGEEEGLRAACTGLSQEAEDNQGERATAARCCAVCQVGRQLTPVCACCCRLLQHLESKAEQRNPDEFYFAMEKAKTKDGMHIQRQVAAASCKSCQAGSSVHKPAAWLCAEEPSAVDPCAGSHKPTSTLKRSCC